MTEVYNLPDGRQVSRGQAFSLLVTLAPGRSDTIQFPANWLELASLDDLNRFGIQVVNTPDPQPAPPTVADLIAYAAEKRRALANGSTTVNVGSRTIPAWVDAESRGAITGLVVASGVIPDLTAPWKGADGAFYTLDAAEITALALGMMQYVQACFAAEAQIVAEITAGTIATTAAIDAAFAAL